MKRVVRVVNLMHILSKLRDLQNEILLLRSCIGITNFFPKKCLSIHMEETSIWFDKEFQKEKKTLYLVEVFPLVAFY